MKRLLTVATFLFLAATSFAQMILRGLRLSFLFCAVLLFTINGAFGQQPTPPDDRDFLPKISPSAVEHEPEIGDNEGGEGVLARREAMIRQRGPLVQYTATQRAKQARKQRDDYPDHFRGREYGSGWWRPIGPYGDRFIENGSFTLSVIDSGRLRAILPDPSDEKTVYLLSGGGGLWRTRNFNESSPDWTPLTDQVGTTSGGAVAFGRKSSTLYLGLGDPFDFPGGSIVKSRDRGDSWTDPIFLGNALTVLDLKVDTSQPEDIVLAGTDDGLFRSADSGRTFSQVAFGGKQVWSIAQTAAGWLAAVQDSDGGIFSQLRSVGIPSSATSTLYLSSDKGKTWLPTGSGLPSYAGRTTLAVATPGDSVVYAIASWYDDTIQDFRQLDLFRSNDGGQHFSAIGLASKTPTNPYNGFPGAHDLNILAEQAWYNQMLLVDPSDSSRNTVYLGGEYSSAKTTDGGQSWRMISDWLAQGNLPYIHADFHCAALRFGRFGKTLLLGTDGGLFTSTDEGLTFDNGQKNRGLQTHLVYSLVSSGTDNRQTLIGTQDDGTRFSGGGPWYNQVLGGDGVGTAWSQFNNFAALGSVFGNVIFRSTNNPPDDISKFSLDVAGIGDFYFNYYTGITTPDPGSDPSGQIFFTWSPSRLYISVDPSGHWYTFAHINWGTGGNINLGGPFQFSFRDVIHNIGIAPNDPDLNHLAAVINGGRVLVTNNGASTFSIVNLQTEVPGYTSFNSNATWASANSLYVTSVQPFPGVVRVAKSNMAGASGSWAAAQNGLPDIPITRLLLDNRDSTGNSLFAATDLGVYRTSDGGQHWRLFGKGLPQVPVLDLYMPPNGTFLRVGTYGRGVWEIGLHTNRDDY